MLGAVQATFMLRCLVLLKVMEVGARGGSSTSETWISKSWAAVLARGAVPDVAVMVML